jgi:hypothetical protein
MLIAIGLMAGLHGLFFFDDPRPPYRVARVPGGCFCAVTRPGWDWRCAEKIALYSEGRT